MTTGRSAGSGSASRSDASMPWASATRLSLVKRRAWSSSVATGAPGTPAASGASAASGAAGSPSPTPVVRSETGNSGASGCSGASPFAIRGLIGSRRRRERTVPPAATPSDHPRGVRSGAGRAMEWGAGYQTGAVDPFGGTVEHRAPTLETLAARVEELHARCEQLAAENVALRAERPAPAPPLAPPRDSVADRAEGPREAGEGDGKVSRRGMLRHAATAAAV